MEQVRGVVNLAEAVELVALNIQQKRVVNRSRLTEFDRVSLVKLQYGDVIVEFSAYADVLQNSGDNASDKIAARVVGENPEPLFFKKLRDNFGGRGLSVRARNYRNTAGELGQNFLDKAWIDSLNNKSREG